MRPILHTHRACSPVTHSAERELLRTHVNHRQLGGVGRETPIKTALGWYLEQLLRYPAFEVHLREGSLPFFTPIRQTHVSRLHRTLQIRESKCLPDGRSLASCQWSLHPPINSSRTCPKCRPPGSCDIHQGLSIRTDPRQDFVLLALNDTFRGSFIDPLSVDVPHTASHRKKQYRYAVRGPCGWKASSQVIREPPRSGQPIMCLIELRNIDLPRRTHAGNRQLLPVRTHAERGDESGTRGHSPWRSACHTLASIHLDRPNDRFRCSWIEHRVQDPPIRRPAESQSHVRIRSDFTRGSSIKISNQQRASVISGMNKREAPAVRRPYSRSLCLKIAFVTGVFFHHQLRVFAIRVHHPELFAYSSAVELRKIKKRDRKSTR